MQKHRVRALREYVDDQGPPPVTNHTWVTACTELNAYRPRNEDRGCEARTKEKTKYQDDETRGTELNMMFMIRTMIESWKLSPSDG